MISPFAIKNYFVKNFRDLNLYKSCDDASLLAYINRKAGYEVKFRRPPRHHDLVCIALCLKFKRLLLLLDMGLGKTSISLLTFRIVKRIDPTARAIVCVPSLSNVGDWCRECQTDAPELKITGVLGTRNERQAIMESDADILIITYMGLLRFLCTAENVKKRKNRKLTLDPKAAKELTSRFRHFILDESSTFGNPESITFRVLRKLSRSADRVYALTGTPFGKDVQPIWGQFFIVDLGETLGETLGFFREAFMSKTKNFWGGFKYSLKKSKEKQLHRIMRNRSIRYEAKDCIDLPPFVEIVRTCVMSDTAWKHYEKIKQAMAEDRENKQILENNFHKARQLTAGYMTVKGPDGSEVYVALATNPKLELLLEVLKEAPEDSKILVFNVYKRTGELLEKTLKKEKIKAMRLYSGSANKENIGRNFNDSPDTKVLICSEAAAYGLNMQAANYNIFFEPPVNPIRYKQMQARTYRSGQKKTVFNVNLAVKNSVDTKIIRALRDGEDVFNAVVNGRKSI